MKLTAKILSAIIFLNAFAITKTIAQSLPRIYFQYITLKGEVRNDCSCEHASKGNFLLKSVVTMNTRMWIPKEVLKYDKVHVLTRDSDAVDGSSDIGDGWYTQSELLSELGPNPYIEFHHQWLCKPNSYRFYFYIDGYLITGYDKKVNEQGIIINVPIYGKPHPVAQSRTCFVSAKNEPLPPSGPIELINPDMGSYSGSSGGGGGTPIVRKKDVTVNAPINHSDGPYTEKNDNGIVIESGEYKGNKKTGVWKKFDAEKGSIYKMTEYAADGSYKETNYSGNGSGKITSVINCNANGDRNGIMKSYDSNGAVEDETTYVNGAQTGPYKKFSNSQLVKSGQYINGQENGICKKYDTKGDPENECTYTNGTQNGPCKFYYKGILTSSGQYKDGKKDGAWKTYDDTGKIVKKTTNYKDGEPQE